MLTRCILLVVLATIAGFPAAGEEADRLLVGLQLDGRDVGSLEILRAGNELVLPVRRFAELSGVGIEEGLDSIRFATPLGSVDIARNRLPVVNGLHYFPNDVLESLLAARVEFDEEEYAVVVHLPWGVSSTGRGEREAHAVLVPDVSAPRNGLSNIRGDVGLSRDRSVTDAGGGVELAGKLADGFWRLGYRDDFDGRHELDGYSWLLGSQPCPHL